MGAHARDVPDETVAALKAAARQARRFQTAAARKTAARDAMILRAVGEGMTQSMAGELAGITTQRVEQIIKRDREERARRAAERARLEGVFDEVYEYFEKAGR